MSSSSNINLYMTPSQLKANFPHFQPLFKAGQIITTQLPESAAMARVFAATVLGMYLNDYCYDSFVGRSMSIISVTFACWTVYSQCMRKDPLMEAFYKIFGGKKHFEKLPEIDIPMNELYQGGIKCLTQIPFPIARGTTKDGRNIVVIKSEGVYERKEEGTFKIFHVFIQKFGPEDCPPTTQFVQKVINSGIFVRPSPTLLREYWKGKTPPTTYESGNTVDLNSLREGIPVSLASQESCIIGFTLSTEMANALAAQVAATLRTGEEKKN